MDMTTAEYAFVQCADLPSIRFVASLKSLLVSVKIVLYNIHRFREMLGYVFNGVNFGSSADVTLHED